MQLLSKGKIQITTENRIGYDYDYRLPATHKTTLGNGDTAKWSDTDNATPIQDIQGWQDRIEEDTGIRPTRPSVPEKRGIIYCKTIPPSLT